MKRSLEKMSIWKDIGKEGKRSRDIRAYRLLIGYVQAELGSLPASGLASLIPTNHMTSSRRRSRVETAILSLFHNPHLALPWLSTPHSNYLGDG